MADQEKRSQKDIALSYGGSADKQFLNGRLDYFHRGHWFRRFRLVLFIICAFGAVALVLGYSRFVGPGARKAWNDDLRKTVQNAKGAKVALPWNPEELFNTGPISENHSRLEGGCQSCHWGSNPDIARLVGIGKAYETQQTVGNSTFAKLGESMKKGGTKGLLATYQKLTKLEQMDVACITCHVNFQQLPVHLHLPQSPQLHLAKVSFPFAVVESGACSNCHKEHVGGHRMADVSSSTCESCHAAPGSTAGTSKVIDILKDPSLAKVVFPSGPDAVLGATTAQVGEGISRFLVWRAPGRTQGFDKEWARPFRFYGPADPKEKSGQGYAGHPPFRYELPNARDAARIRFGHMQHEQPRVTNLFDKNFERDMAAVAGLPIREWLNADGSQNCLFCHESGADGEYRQKISFERHCQVCHRMDIVVPPLQNATTGATYNFASRISIPHRDPEKVRAFFDLQSIMVELDRAALSNGMQDPKSRRDYVDTAVTNLVNREMRNQLEVLKRVFYTGDPAYESWRQSPTTNRALNSCSLCHREMLQPQDVKDYNDVSRAPAMLPANIAHRWANHGPFTHDPHKHMKCADCHANNNPIIDPRTGQTVMSNEWIQDPAAAKKAEPLTYSVKSAHDSKITADILMPRQRLCAECHRPMPREAASELAAAGGPTSGQNVKAQSPEERARWQRATGGIKYECLDCHKFHAPTEAMPFWDELTKTGKPQAAAEKAGAPR